MIGNKEIGSLRQIRKYGDEILRRKAREVPAIDGRIKEIVQEMFEVMYSHEGIGLAAPQIGESIRIVVADLRKDGINRPFLFINPVILSQEGEDWMEEGCLSLPGITGVVKRANKVIVEAEDESGKKRTLFTSGLLARVLLHEVDHLDGVLFIDRMEKEDRLALKGELKRLKREYKSQKSRLTKKV
jgi:peptide deformylase